MEPKVNYTVVGLFVVMLGIALVFVFFWLTAVKQGKVYRTYLVYVHEEVTGLTIDGPVRYNGVPVGFVSRIELDPNNPQLVRLMLKVEEGTPITTSTIATLRTQGISGIIYVGLKAQTEHAPLLRPRPGQKYPVIPAKPSLLMQLSEVVPRLSKTVSKIGDSINKLLSQQNRVAINETLQNLSKFTKTLSDNSKNLDASMISLKETLANTAQATKKLPEVITQMDTSFRAIENTSESVKKTADAFSRVSLTLDTTLKTGQSALNGFSTQVVPGLQQVMMRLDSVMANVNQITAQMTRNPAILVRGKMPERPGPGER